MQIMTRVKLVVAETPRVGVPGAKLSLYDRDQENPDDLLATGITDAQGEVVFTYDSAAFTDNEDGPEWSMASLPDLYVVVYNAAGEEVLNTRSQTVDDQLPRVLIVSIGRELAEQHGLLRATS